MIPAIPKSAVWRERDHPAVGREEDQARGGDPEDERLEQDRVRPVGAPAGDRPDDHDEHERRRPRSRARAAAAASRPRVHPALPNRPRGPEREHERDQDEGEDRRVLRAAVGARSSAGTTRRSSTTKAKRIAPAAAPKIEPMPPTITTTSEFSSHWPSWPDEMFDCDAQTTAPRRGERRADDEGDREGLLDVDPERRGHLLVVDAGADDHAGLRPVEPEPEPDADRDADREHHEPRERVLDAADVQIDEPVGPARPRQVDGVAAELLRARRDVAREVGDDLVGDDHGDGDRDQRLAQLLALVPAQERLLHDEPDDRDARRGDEQRHEPLPGVHLARLEREALTGHRLLDLVRDVAGEEVEARRGPCSRRASARRSGRSRSRR